MIDRHVALHRRAAAEACRSLAAARERHLERQAWAVASGRPIRARTHAATAELAARACRAQTLDPTPPEPCDCGICRHYISRRLP